MAKANPVNYAAAHKLVASGAWRIDPSTGKIFGVKGRELRHKDVKGYIHLAFHHPGRREIRYQVLAHRLIWEHVNGSLDPSLTVNHIDGDKTNNRIENLEAITVAENVRHAWRTGLITGRRRLKSSPAGAIVPM